MGVAGWPFAHKTKDNGRSVVIAILEVWPMFCAAAVAAGAMIMIAVMLYNEWSAGPDLGAMRKNILTRDREIVTTGTQSWSWVPETNHHRLLEDG